MKKTYKNPTLKVVNIQSGHVMIGTSGDYDGRTIQSRGSRYSEWEDDDAAEYEE